MGRDRDGLLWLGVMDGLMVVSGLTMTAIPAIRAVGTWDLQPSSLADWVSAASTFLGFIAAGVAAVYAARAFGRQQEIDRERQADKRRLQASMVSARATHLLMSENFGNGRHPVHTAEIRLRVRNQSPDSAYAVRVRVLAWVIEPGNFETLARPAEPVVTAASLVVRELEPSSFGQEPIELDSPALADLARSLSPGERESRIRVGVELIFIDSAGVEWIRLPGGRLQEYKSDAK